MLSAVKLYHWVSISGPSATAKPRSAKISASSSMTWLTGWTVPCGISGAGSERSSLSVASFRSSSAFSSAAFRLTSASVTCSRSAWIFGASRARVSASIEPRDLRSAVIEPALPSADTRSASRSPRLSAAAIRSSMVSASIIDRGSSLGSPQNAKSCGRRSGMSDWPELSVERDHETLAILHLAAQMLGKLRVAHAPWMNHGWHAALQPNARGLGTLPTAASGGRTFTLTLDLCRHAIVLWISDGGREELPLNAGSVAALHKRLVEMLDRHGLPVDFNGKPNEIPDAVPFAEDKLRRDYDRDSAERFREALAAMLPVFARFRAGFAGKASPVHFWWGRFDLAVTRFSGRAAPRHPGGVPGLPDRITREAYSHEVSSAGFWAGGVTAAEPFFYSYAYPEPAGFRERELPVGGFDGQWQEFILPYAEVRAASDPEGMLTEFMQSTYAAAADLADWDRAALEREPAAP